MKRASAKTVAKVNKIRETYKLGWLRNKFRCPRGQRDRYPTRFVEDSLSQPISAKYFTIQGFSSGISTSTVSQRLSGSMV